MGEPLPYDPEQRPKPPHQSPPISRADWLVGAEEGMSAEVKPEEPPTPIPFDRPKLVRREPAEAERPQGAPRLPETGRVVIRAKAAPTGPPPPPPPGAAPPPPPKATLPKWDAGQNSVPMIRHEEQDARHMPSSPIPELTRDFPMDDAEERARVSAQRAEQRAEEDAVAARPHAVVSPADFVLPDAAPPWWKNIPELLATDRRAQLAALCLVLILALMTFWPRPERTISVAHLTEQPERYADAQVRVSGRIAEVFPVGGSWAYTLIQGRDTIVVFTRTRQPKRDERVVVVGTLSTGFLDGVSRAAIFESTAR